MLMDIIAMIAAGAGLAGVILLLRKLLRGRLPGWTLPAGIGAGMLAFTLWSEYSWYPRVTGVLPDEVAVVLAPGESSPFRPWTYLFPLHTRFVALDGTGMIRSAANPALRQADVMIVERWLPTKRIGMAFDCAGGAQADLVEGATLAADGTLAGATWRPAATDDPLQTAACREG